LASLSVRAVYVALFWTFLPQKQSVFWTKNQQFFPVSKPKIFFQPFFTKSLNSKKFETISKYFACLPAKAFFVGLFWSFLS
jgi:hypothetical protein